MNGVLGEIRLFSGSSVPQYFLACDGTQYNISQYPLLFSVIKNTYGGDGVNTFKVPNLQGLVPVGTGALPDAPSNTIALGATGGSVTIVLSQDELPSHNHTPSSVTLNANIFVSSANATQATPSNYSSLAAPVATGTSPSAYNLATPNTSLSTNTLKNNGLTLSNAGTGSSAPHNNMQPYLGMRFLICAEADPSAYGSQDVAGEILMYGGATPPQNTNWMLCQGQILQIQNFPTLFSIISNKFGGDGITTFALPDMRGRVAVGTAPGNPGAASNTILGQKGGESIHQLTELEMPSHTHAIVTGSLRLYASANAAQTNAPSGASIASSAGPSSNAVSWFNTTPPDTQLNSQSVWINGSGSMFNNPNGSDNTHSNMQPYIGISFMISTSSNTIGS